MDFCDRHVVVTGGTGALGRAVVDALLAAGAHCHVPYRQEKEKESLPGRALNLIPAPSLADEAVVRKLYGGLPALWASIRRRSPPLLLILALPLEAPFAALHGDESTWAVTRMLWAAPQSTGIDSALTGPPV